MMPYIVQVNGGVFKSSDGRYSLKLQTDGNLVWLDQGTALWNTFYQVSVVGAIVLAAQL
jgi:hypothetical protein